MCAGLASISTITRSVSGSEICSQSLTSINAHNAYLVLVESDRLTEVFEKPKLVGFQKPKITENRPKTPIFRLLHITSLLLYSVTIVQPIAFARFSHFASLLNFMM